MSANAMKGVHVDENFYSDFDLVSRFDEKIPDYQSSLVGDTLNAKNYFFNNSFNLTWKSGSPSSSSPEIDASGNAFLLNILLPEWITAHHPERYSYSPDRYVGGDTVEILLGTSFSFVKKLFDKVNNWGTEVNNTASQVNLKDQSNKGTSNKLYFSHPWPTKKNSVFEQQHLYSLKGGADVDIFTTEVYDPYMFSIDAKDVSAIYAAVDLKVNTNLLRLNFGSKQAIKHNLHYIHSQKNDGQNEPAHNVIEGHQKGDPVHWSETVNSWGTNYKFAVDFAVIKVKLSIAKLRDRFLEYLINLYKRTEHVPRVIRSDLEIKNRRTPPIYLAGWDTMSERDRILHDMSRLYIKSDIKTTKSSEASNQNPSIYANENKFNECCDLNIYEDSTSSATSNDYEIISKEYFPNNDAGLLTVKFKVKHKTKNIVSEEQRQAFIWGFKEGSTSTNDNTSLKKHTQEMINKSRKFAGLSPKVYAKWKEYNVKYSYFPLKNIKQHLEDYSYRGGSDFNLEQPNRYFELNNQRYLNIGHNLLIPNANMVNSKGTLAIMKSPTRDEKVMLGMYDGISKWTNVVSRKERYVGNVTMFISPLRYDLFNQNNSLSKPSLGDVLVKKCLDARLIQLNRFRVQRRDLENTNCPTPSNP